MVQCIIPNMNHPFGPIILDLVGTELNQEEQEILQHPLVGGVILFTRNYQDPEQLRELCRAIRASRPTPLLITVDHEGGRVQRFKQGFTVLPSMGEVGKQYREDPIAGLKAAENCGRTMASELLAAGIDLSFAPVLDLDKDICPAIGDRAFSDTSEGVSILATAVMRGMQSAGMAAVGKHFPGHGSVNLDSHVAIPIDTRSLSTILAEDIQPFATLIQAGIPAIMPAHIIFPAVDDKPVGFSKVWLQDVLRKQLQFKGVIISDDLNMQGASFAGDYASRAQCALEAGCDMILICNNRAGAIQILDGVSAQLSANKFNLLRGVTEYVTRRANNEYTG